MRPPLVLSTTLLLLLSPSALASDLDGPAAHPRSIERIRILPEEYIPTGQSHVIAQGIQQPNLGGLRAQDHPVGFTRVKRSLMAMLVGGAVGDPSVAGSGQAVQRRSPTAFPVLALPAEHEHDGSSEMVKRGLAALIIGGAVGDPNVAGSGSGSGSAREKREDGRREEKRWVWGTSIIQDGDPNAPPVGSNVNQFSDPPVTLTTPSNPPPTPSLSPPEGGEPVDQGPIKIPRPAAAPTPSTTTPAELPHTKNRKMWNSQSGSKTGARTVGALVAAPPAASSSSSLQTPGAGRGTPRTKPTSSAPAEEEGKVEWKKVEPEVRVAAAAEPAPAAAPAPAAVEDDSPSHPRHKFSYGAAAPAASPAPEKRWLRGPTIIQDDTSVEDLPLYSGGNEANTPNAAEVLNIPSPTGIVPAPAPVEVEASAEEGVWEAIGEVLVDEKVTSASVVERRSGGVHAQNAMGHKMRIKRVYKAPQAFEERSRVKRVE